MKDFQLWVARRLLKLTFWCMSKDKQLELANQFQLLMLKLENDAPVVEDAKNV